MSFILDALKKSESQRRLGQAPGLDTPVMMPPPRRSGRWLGFIMFGLVCVLGGFVLWREFLPPEPPRLAGQPSAGQPDRPADLPAGEMPQADVPEPRPAPPEAYMAEATLEDPGVAREEEAAEDSETRPTSDRRSPGGVTRARQLAYDPEAGQRRDAERQAERERQEAMVREWERRQQAMEDQAMARHTRRRQQTGAGELAMIDPAPDMTVDEDHFDLPRDQLVQRWELPASVRRELPDLNVMMHVYADDPDSRFIVVGGERYSEGEALAAGVTLHEIRREGAVVDFRNYRFLIN